MEPCTPPYEPMGWLCFSSWEQMLSEGTVQSLLQPRKPMKATGWEAYLKDRPHIAKAQQVEDSIQSQSLNCSFSIKKLVILVFLNKTFAYEIQIPLHVSGLPILRRKKVGAHPLKAFAVSEFHDGDMWECIQRCCTGKISNAYSPTSFSTESEMWKS